MKLATLPPAPQWSPELPTKTGLWMFAPLITRADFVQYYAHPRVYRVRYDKRREALVAQVNHNDTRPLSALRGVWIKVTDLPRNVIEVQS